MTESTKPVLSELQAWTAIAGMWGSWDKGIWDKDEWFIYAPYWHGLGLCYLVRSFRDCKLITTSIWVCMIKKIRAAAPEDDGCAYYWPTNSSGANSRKLFCQAQIRSIEDGL